MANNASASSPLENLPLEILTQISDHLHVYDLERFRMACKTTAEAVFERIVTLMPKALTVHGKRSASLLDLAYLGATFKMNDAITRLRIFHMKPEFSHLLVSVRLPGLVSLHLANGRVDSEERVVKLLENHRRTLREVRVEVFCISVEMEVLVARKTGSWRRIAKMLEPGGGLGVRRRVLQDIGYCAPDGKEESRLVRAGGARDQGYAPASKSCLDLFPVWESSD